METVSTSPSSTLPTPKIMTKHLANEMLDLAQLRSRFMDTRDKPNIMYGYLRGFVNHLERTVPGVQEAIQEEITRLKVQKFNTEK